MATRTRKQPTEPEPEPQAEVPSYNFEPIDDELQSRLNVWGNSTQLTVQQLQIKYPNWAQMLNDVFDIVKALVNEHGQ